MMHVSIIIQSADQITHAHERVRSVASEGGGKQGKETRKERAVFWGVLAICDHEHQPRPIW